jgi:hypothetical protein
VLLADERLVIFYDQLDCGGPQAQLAICLELSRFVAEVMH